MEGEEENWKEITVGSVQQYVKQPHPFLQAATRKTRSILLFVA